MRGKTTVAAAIVGIRGGGMIIAC
eukprot:COSAG01_NODE_19817_length_987_cov_2.443694_1_plen_23_part_01